MCSEPPVEMARQQSSCFGCADFQMCFHLLCRFLAAAPFQFLLLMIWLLFIYSYRMFPYSHHSDVSTQLIPRSKCLLVFNFLFYYIVKRCILYCGPANQTGITGCQYLFLQMLFKCVVILQVGASLIISDNYDFTSGCVLLQLQTWQQKRTQHTNTHTKNESSPPPSEHPYRISPLFFYSVFAFWCI